MKMATTEPQTHERTLTVRSIRALGIAATATAALVAWALIEPVFGIELRGPAFGDTAETSDVAAVQVLLASTIGGLAGWTLLALLERLTTRAARIWLVVAVVALLLSLGGPLSGDGVTAVNRAALVALHLVVGAVLIPTLYLSAKRATRKESP